MNRPTKAELEARLSEMFAAFDRLMASHIDLTSGHVVNFEWAKRVAEETSAIRHNLKERRR